MILFSTEEQKLHKFFVLMFFCSYVEKIRFIVCISLMKVLGDNLGTFSYFDVKSNWDEYHQVFQFFGTFCCQTDIK